MIDPDTITNKAGQPGDDYDANVDTRKKRSEARLELRAIREGWAKRKVGYGVEDADRKLGKDKVIEALEKSEPKEQPRSIAILMQTMMAMDKDDREHAAAVEKASRLDNDEPTENVVFKLKFGGAGGQTNENG